MSQHDRYISPFSTRYASDEMQYIFSEDNKFRTWRRLWVALARAEMNQGLDNITPAMVAELEAHVDDINYEVAAAREKLVRHDVMSHVYAYGQQCPQAAGIIHLGATSCYVGDNTDIIVMRQGLELVRKKLVGVLAKLARFAKEYKDMPCMAYTHGQPAQPTTVGKRATLWANELVMDLGEIEHRLETLQLRGVKGTTGTQASFMELFKGDAGKIRAVDAEIAQEMGFDPKAVIPVSGQTYSRKVDALHPQRPGRHRSELHEVCHRPASAGQLQGDGGALREKPDRFLGHALQAQPHALRAHLRPGPVPDGGCAQPQLYRRHPVV